MKSYPIMLNVSGRRVVVIGGGGVGVRKARSLLDAGAKVELVVPPDSDIPNDLKDVTVITAPYKGQMLEGAFLVFACSNDRELNSQVGDDARRIGVMVNVADAPDECDFFAPATVSRGKVIVAIGTSGLAPALAVYLKKLIDSTLSPQLADFAEALGRVRENIAENRTTIMKRLASDNAYRAFLDGGYEALLEMSKND